VKKSIQFFFTSFRRKPESSVFKVLRTYWIPVFTGVTAENQFFHSFGGSGGISAMAFPIDIAWQNLDILQLKDMENLAPCLV
jgi:hypothetical protein